MKSGEFLFSSESHIGYIAPSTGLAAEPFTKIICNDEVKSQSSLLLSSD